MAQLVKNPPAMQESWVPFSWVGKIPWRRERLPTAVFWPGECHGLNSPWGRKESDTTKPLSLSFIFYPFHKLSPFYKLNYLIYHCYKIFSHMSLPTTLIISSVIKSINLSFILHIFFLVCCFTFSFIHIF